MVNFLRTLHKFNTSIILTVDVLAILGIAICKFFLIISSHSIMSSWLIKFSLLLSFSLMPIELILGVIFIFNDIFHKMKRLIIIDIATLVIEVSIIVTLLA